MFSYFLLCIALVDRDVFFLISVNGVSLRDEHFFLSLRANVETKYCLNKKVYLK